MEESYLYSEETYKIIGACMEVHNNLGSGFLEAVYQKAICKEMDIRSIPYEKNVRFKVYYNSIDLGKYYVADIVCYDKIIVEIKAMDFLHANHSRQLLNYLKVTGRDLGLLVNFGEGSLKVKRIINSAKKSG